MQFLASTSWFNSNFGGLSPISPFDCALLNLYTIHHRFEFHLIPAAHCNQKLLEILGKSFFCYHVIFLSYSPITGINLEISHPTGSLDN